MAEIAAKNRVFAVINIFIITIIVLLNLILFRHNLKSLVVWTSGDVDIFTELPTGTAVPLSTEANHVHSVIQQRFDERAERVRHICSIPGHIATSVAKPTELISVPSVDLLWCPTFEAGHSNWVDLFCKVASNIKFENVSCDIDILRKINNSFTKIEENLQNEHLGLPFMTVRNPLVRLLSTYRTFFEGASDLHYYTQFGETIVKKHRMIDLKLSDAETSSLLKEANFEIHERSSQGIDQKNSHNPFLDPPGPTFSEFVQWILDDGYKNPYTAPYYERCAPCFIDYSILRLEKLYEESDHLFTVIKKSYLNFDFSMSFNDNRYTENCILKYYKTLLGDDLHQLYEQLFKVDCELFSYPCKETVSFILSHDVAATSEDLC